MTDRSGAPTRLVMLGRQGSGKGTQCARLAGHFGLAHLSTGDLLREAVRAGTDLGRRVQRYLDEGDLVPDGLIVATVNDAVATLDRDTQGFLLDGFPRTIAQAEALLAAQGAIDAALDLEVPTDVALDRLARRRVCEECGSTTTVASQAIRFVACPRCTGVAVRRADDKPAAIQRRLALYAEQTGPLLDWFDAAGLLVRVDGVGAPEVVFDRIMTAVAPQVEVRAS